MGRLSNATAGSSSQVGWDGPPTVFLDWFADRGWEPFPFQREVWQAMAAGGSGLLHAPTGTGKKIGRAHV